MPPVSSSHAVVQDASRARKLQLLGILCGFAAGAWLGAGESPPKFVSTVISPMVISFIMVIGVFLARWSLPALILGTSSGRADVRRAPHLIIWALLTACQQRPDDQVRRPANIGAARRSAQDQGGQAPAGEKNTDNHDEGNDHRRDDRGNKLGGRLPSAEPRSRSEAAKDAQQLKLSRT